MQTPKNRKVVVVGYAAATALGSDFAGTWQRALTGEAGFRRLSRCQVDHISLATNNDYVQALLRLFKQRGRA
mgnify:CR=1 FL=1